MSESSTTLPQGWLVTDCARCGNLPVLTPVDDPNNNELRVCHRCDAHLGTCENCGAKEAHQAKTYAVELQVTTTVHVFPEATSPGEAERLVRENWGELTRFDHRALPSRFDEGTMSVRSVREVD
ncbi:hypothetical protein [Ornithinimicrobium murale]|uniref:hypothetical protein n=1 Tax=Ornithinimicrobium murale TaxID=1050153 RepID=UPI000E0D23AA|nr:hypothetical protein [Ornithinimicrobium murale]